MNKITKALNFTPAVKKRIDERDGDCPFCKADFHMVCENEFEYFIKDYMHIVGKGRGGLGIEQNGIRACRWHHKLFDSNSPGVREDMDLIVKDYMTSFYPDWNIENLYYKKYQEY